MLAAQAVMIKTVIFAMGLCLCGCLAGGANPRKYAYETLSNKWSQEFASKVIKCGMLTNEEIADLVVMAKNGDQNILYFILANGWVKMDVQMDLIRSLDGWGLQGIGSNEALYRNKNVVELMKGKQDGMSRDVYRILWVKNGGDYPYKLE